jgi:hypothetical protein
MKYGKGGSESKYRGEEDKESGSYRYADLIPLMIVGMGCLAPRRSNVVNRLSLLCSVRITLRPVAHGPTRYLNVGAWSTG